MNSFAFLKRGLVSGAALTLAVVAVVGASLPVQAASATDWPMYQGDAGRTGFNGAATAISQATVGGLRPMWTLNVGGSISGEPLVANNTLYWGAWDGYLRAATTSGRLLWQTYVGKTTGAKCYPTNAGVASTPAYTTIGATPALVVGGGDGAVYAVNASTGHILWRTVPESDAGLFLWSSPIVDNGNVYIGLASFGDCPLVRGGVTELSAQDGSIENTYLTVPDGCLGASVWGSPALDTNSGTLYVVTGNSGSCSTDEPYQDAILALSASDLSLQDSWQLPANEQLVDADFGATPTLFTANGTNMIGVASKNGWYYALNRDMLSMGPVWQQRVADVGGDCVLCGEGSISSSAWDGAHLFVGGGKATIVGKQCGGNLTGLNPATGAYLWRMCLPSPVAGAIAAVPGLVMVAQSNNLMVLKVGNGENIKQLYDTRSGTMYLSGASVVGGRIYIGNMNGDLNAYGL
jgi:polyvinyl alcohol dehydrogenase (cytochrome)